MECRYIFLWFFKALLWCEKESLIEMFEKLCLKCVLWQKAVFSNLEKNVPWLNKSWESLSQRAQFSVRLQKMCQNVWHPPPLPIQRVKRLQKFGQHHQNHAELVEKVALADAQFCHLSWIFFFSVKTQIAPLKSVCRHLRYWLLPTFIFTAHCWRLSDRHPIRPGGSHNIESLLAAPRKQHRQSITIPEIRTVDRREYVMMKSLAGEPMQQRRHNVFISNASLGENSSALGGVQLGGPRDGAASNIACSSNLSAMRKYYVIRTQWSQTKSGRFYEEAHAKSDAIRNYIVVAPFDFFFSRSILVRTQMRPAYTENITEAIQASGGENMSTLSSINHRRPLGEPQNANRQVA